MDNPRVEKVAVVDEVRVRLSNTPASVITEYRGLSVAELKELRSSLAAAGGDYKIFKNTLVKLAIRGGDYQLLEEFLTGPTGLTFVNGEINAVAKALVDFSKANPNLVIKGGMMNGSVLSVGELNSLANLPPRPVLLAKFAGALAAPMQQLAGLMQALPRNLAYGLAELLTQRRSNEQDVPSLESSVAPESPASDDVQEATPEIVASDEEVADASAQDEAQVLAETEEKTEEKAEEKAEVSETQD